MRGGQEPRLCWNGSPSLCPSYRNHSITGLNSLDSLKGQHMCRDWEIGKNRIEGLLESYKVTSDREETNHRAIALAAPLWFVSRACWLDVRTIPSYRKNSKATCESAATIGSAKRLLRPRPPPKPEARSTPIPIPAPNSIIVSLPGFSRP